MSAPFYLEDASGRRRIETGEFPLAVGGAAADIAVAGAVGAEPVAWLGIADGELFVQSTNGRQPVTCNGAPVATSQWLHDGDVLRVGTTRIGFTSTPEESGLRVEQIAADDVTEPPQIVAETAADPLEARVEPVEFRPRRTEQASPRRRRFGPAAVAVWVVLAALGGIAWLVFTTAAVRVEVEPEPDRVDFDGGWFSWEVSDRHLLRPGAYVLIAEKAGYRRLEAPLEVTGEINQTFRFTLEKLPGRLAVDAGAVQGVRLVVDGAPAVPLAAEPIELSPGEHLVRLEADRHEPFEAIVEIEGGGVLQTLQAELLPRWAPVTFQSRPPGASIVVDGRARGRTPATVQLLEGGHRYELELAGHKTHRAKVEVTAREPQTVAVVRLKPSDAVVRLVSEPPGAAVTVDGAYRGNTPVELGLRPGEPHDLRITKAGFDSATRRVTLGPGAVEEIALELPPRRGEIEVVAAPPDAELVVDGEPRGAANQLLRLVAVPHEIEVRKEGFVPFRTSVTPRPGFPQSVRVTLKTAEEIKAEATPRAISTPQGQRLVLIDGGRFTMGAPRREPGRRANETLREVELTRKFYLATTEVTNRQFREFRPRHLSGKAGPNNLEIDHHPVVRVSWEEAALYCNWLSQQEGLEPVYVKSGGQVSPVRPIPTGYRLPTEAEWAFVARHAPGQPPRKYAWGPSMPIPEGAGNFADESAQGMLTNTVEGYDDRYPATAPVDAFDANPLGMLNLDGNVAEWTHDLYVVYRTDDDKVERDPIGPDEGEFHVIRGSSWMDSSVSELRLSFRDYGKDPRPDLGFRIARYAE